jgi:hypothetical protein
MVGKLNGEDRVWLHVKWNVIIWRRNRWKKLKVGHIIGKIRKRVHGAPVLKSKFIRNIAPHARRGAISHQRLSIGRETGHHSCGAHRKHGDQENDVLSVNNPLRFR